MTQNLYIGNLPFTATEEEVRAHFSQHGEVKSVRLITDRYTGQPRGFGFVEMEDEGATKAQQSLDGADFGGRALKVNPARPKEERGSGGGDRGGGW